MRALAREGGFTLAEMLVAAAITLTACGAVFQLMNPAHGAGRLHPETADLHQRLRVAVDALVRDLSSAGTAPYLGAFSGSLSDYIAPVLPYRQGDLRSDPASGVYFRREVVTAVHVPAAPAQGVLRDEASSVSGILKLEQQGNCPNGRLCGFAEGMRVALFDGTGAWDAVTITARQDELLQLQYDGALSGTYKKGATVSQVTTSTYYLEGIARGGSPRLMHYDGVSTDLPVVDDVVRLEFEYFGDPRPPRILSGVALDDPIGPWTTYGPKPPPPGVPGVFGWPAGENCLFRISDGQHQPRLDVLGDGTGEVRLANAELTDGPWCPHAGSANRFDADLLRVRRVSVLLRVQAAAASLRGRGVLFARPGTAPDGGPQLPDHQIRFDVSPRNLNAGR
jgi:hypothetical protein